MTKKILINDGIHPTGESILRSAGYELGMERVQQEDLHKVLKDYDAICVRSATKVRKDLIDHCPNLKAIGRGGVGLDNIDVAYAKSKNIAVLNTPAASSRSVAELAFAHMLSLSRFVYQSNRAMPQQGADEFKKLKKSYAKGVELEGKSLGIIGMGRIGQSAAEIAMGLGMDVYGVDPIIDKVQLNIGAKKLGFQMELETIPMEEMLPKCDYISLHTPNIGRYILGKSEFELIKPGAILINCSRGGTIDEEALLNALEDGRISAAGLDVFENEPTPNTALLNHPKISLTPHIGASTKEAQEKIGIELAEKLIEVLG